MKDESHFWAGFLVGGIMGAVLTVLFSMAAHAKDWDSDQPTNPDPEFWRESTVQSCCGVGDAYWADEWEVLPDGHWRVWITDPRNIKDRIPLDGRAITLRADQIRTPPNSPVNRSGHGIVFVGQNPGERNYEFNDEPYSYCYFPGAGG